MLDFTRVSFRRMVRFALSVYSVIDAICCVVIVRTPWVGNVLADRKEKHRDDSSLSEHWFLLDDPFISG